MYSLKASSGASKSGAVQNSARQGIDRAVHVSRCRARIEHAVPSKGRSKTAEQPGKGPERDFGRALRRGHETRAEQRGKVTRVQRLGRSGWAGGKLGLKRYTRPGPSGLFCCAQRCIEESEAAPPSQPRSGVIVKPGAHAPGITITHPPGAPKPIPP
jgi:hypothetical protein